MGRWGCQQYESLKIYSDTTISFISNMIRNLKKLRSLYLNLRSWGYENDQISNISVDDIFKSIGSLTDLENLSVNLTK